jgi:hypothetical protein
VPASRSQTGKVQYDLQRRLPITELFRGVSAPVDQYNRLLPMERVEHGLEVSAQLGPNGTALWRLLSS